MDVGNASAARGTVATRDVTGTAASRFGGLGSPLAGLDTPGASIGAPSFFMTDLTDRQSAAPTQAFKHNMKLNLTAQAKPSNPMSSGVSPSQRNVDTLRENSFGAISQIPMDELVAREKKKLQAASQRSRSIIMMSKIDKKKRAQLDKAIEKKLAKAERNFNAIRKEKVKDLKEKNQKEFDAYEKAK